MSNQEQDFKTQKEIFEYLVSGRKIQCTDGRIVEFDDLGTLTVQNYRFNYPADWKKYVEPKWYDNIPEQGVLCRVWHDEGGLDTAIINIKEYDPGSVCRFVADHALVFAHAVPLTEEEALALLIPPRPKGRRFRLPES